MRMRADSFLVQHGYVESREKGKRLILNGHVTVDGQLIRKASEEIEDNLPHDVTVTDTDRYVSRGGYKLEAALDTFGISPEGKRCLDIGASTGGFTDCLLQRGAETVIDLDVGERQLAPSVRENSRVISLEHYNARNLCLSDLGEQMDLVVLDVSFISQTYILPNIPGVLRPGGSYIGLIKPQFEAGKSALKKGGIVRDPSDRRMAVKRVYECGMALGLRPIGFCRSPIEGGDGNREYLICFVKDADGADGCFLPNITLEEMERQI